MENITFEARLLDFVIIQLEIALMAALVLVVILSQVVVQDPSTCFPQGSSL